jgi:hypothetical protein
VLLTPCTRRPSLLIVEARPESRGRHGVCPGEVRRARLATARMLPVAIPNRQARARERKGRDLVQPVWDCVSTAATGGIVAAAAISKECLAALDECHRLGFEGCG